MILINAETPDVTRSIWHPERSKEQRPVKLKASNQILEIYRSNKQRLALEMARPVKDKACLNSIEAYRHIVAHLEQSYNLAV